MIFNCGFIPIKHDGALVGWVIEKMTDGEKHYQFTTVFADKVNRIADDDMEFAIIYGYDTSYLYDRKELYMLGSVSVFAEERAVSVVKDERGTVVYKGMDFVTAHTHRKMYICM